jgi:hypothetical protein
MESRGPLREETLERLGGRHLTVGLPQHPHQHRSEHPVLLQSMRSSAKARLSG